MKFIRRQLASGFTFGLITHAGLQADGATLSNNPYGTIVARNIFGLDPTP
jgi:hypothetical protein